MEKTRASQLRRVNRATGQIMRSDRAVRLFAQHYFLKSVSHDKLLKQRAYRGTGSLAALLSESQVSAVS
jgi:hypothetical protein